MPVSKHGIYPTGPSFRRAGPWASLLAAALLVAGACSPDGSATEPDASHFLAEGAAGGTYYGPVTRIGDGTGRTYLTVRNGVVQEIGIALTEKALSGLPAGPGHANGTHDHFNAFELRMHPQNPTPVQHAVVNWNAEGHEPEEIYGLPHFDFHFYMITPDEVAAIVPSNPQWTEKANRLPPASYIPTNYLSTHEFIPGATPADATVPLMGLHWVDMTSPELAGATFTETFIYGSWDGRIIFLEPMITKAFLQTKPELRRELPAAQQGFNPGSYRIYWHAARQEYRIALTDLPVQQ